MEKLIFPKMYSGKLWRGKAKAFVIDIVIMMTYIRFMDRTTIRINPNLLKKAKQLAIEKDTSLQQVVNWSLEMFLNSKNEALTVSDAPMKLKEWPTLKLGKDLDKLILDKDFIYGTPTR